LDIVNAYAELGSYRAAAELCGTTHKTVRRIIQRHRAGTLGQRPRPPRRPRNTDRVTDLIARRIKQTDGRISAKRLLPEARAAGYQGSARNFRRAVAPIRAEWRRRRRILRPWLPTPGEHLVIDWGTEAGLQVFCAVVAWSRWRFVRFARNQRRETTLRLLAECLEALGGVPKVVLADRMACLKAGVVANVVVPHPDYVRFASHYGFRPDFCEAADPESKGVVEALVGYAKADLVVPGAASWTGLAEANQAAVAWCQEVNARTHSQTCAVPADRLAAEQQVLRPLPSLRPPLRGGETRKVDRLATVRFGSARYSVPARLVGMTVQVTADDHHVVSAMVRPRWRATRWRRRGRRRSATTTTAGLGPTGVGRPGRSGPAARPSRPSWRLGRWPSGSCGRRLRRGRRGWRPSWPPSWLSPPRTAIRPFSPRWSGRPASAGSPPRACGRCWRRGRQHPRSPSPASRLPSSSLPPLRAGPWPPTRPRCCDDRPQRPAARTRPGGGAQAPEAGPHPGDGTPDPAAGQDPAVDA
jgi:transposase